MLLERVRVRHQLRPFLEIEPADDVVANGAGHRLPAPGNELDEPGLLRRQYVRRQGHVRRHRRPTPWRPAGSGRDTAPANPGSSSARRPQSPWSWWPLMMPDQQRGMVRDRPCEAKGGRKPRVASVERQLARCRPGSCSCGVARSSAGCRCTPSADTARARRSAPPDHCCGPGRRSVAAVCRVAGSSR